MRPARRPDRPRTRSSPRRCGRTLRRCIGRAWPAVGRSAKRRQRWCPTRRQRRTLTLCSASRRRCTARSSYRPGPWVSPSARRCNGADLRHPGDKRLVGAVRLLANPQHLAGTPRSFLNTLASAPRAGTSSAPVRATACRPERASATPRRRQPPPGKRGTQLVTAAQRAGRVLLLPRSASTRLGPSGPDPLPPRSSDPAASAAVG
jgi:hypothetical protein